MTPHPETDPVTAAAPTTAAPSGLVVGAGVALAYGLFGAAALALAGSPVYASPLYPPAGVALAAVLVYGRSALAGVLVGAFVVSVGLGAVRGQSGLTALLLPLVLAAGATLQAGIGAALVRRWVSQPLVLDAPRDIVLTGLLGGALACTVSPSVATLALLSFGIVGTDSAVATWGTWWVGDTMGVLIGTPLMLTLVGRPRADWAPRRRTLALPLLLAMALLGGAMVELTQLERERVQATFERDADRLASEAQLRLALPLHALQALHSSARANGALDRDALRQAARWWLAQSDPLQAMGYSERVPLAALPAYEAAAQAPGRGRLRVFDRDGGAARRADGEVLVLRHVEPEAGNAGAIGVNTLSIPAARAAVLATQASGEPAATAGFRLTQFQGDETGIVLYQALYRRDADPPPSQPADAERRRAAMRGVVFVSLRTEQAMAGLAQEGAGYLRWCLVDTAPGVERALLAGRRDCGQPGRDPAATLLSTVKPLRLADRQLELRIDAPADGVPGHQRETAWLLAASGLTATAMLCALLLTVTGHSRRTEVAVQAGTAELRRGMAERRQAEAAARESELRLRSILDHVPIGVMFLDGQGRILEANPRLCEMLGQDAARLRGAAVDELVHPEEAPRLRSLQAELLARGGDGALDRLRLQAGGGGAELMVRITASALDRAGAVGRIVAVVEDITAALRLQASESALHRAEAANRAKTEFVSRMSHELRTPLNAMIGFTQLLGLDRDQPLADHQREWTQQVLRAGWHLLEMINETLDLARIESGAVQLSVSPVALPALVAACRAMVATTAVERGVVVGESLDADAGAVLADATRLKQVLTNLLSNAVKYNREGGTVTVTTRRVPPAAGGEGPPTGWIEIAVADDGLGMTPEQLASLFEPYNRLGRESSGIEGTGIGLVISRRLTELMGGTLAVASEAGKGSIFTARLPAAALAEVPPSQYTDTSPAPYQERLVHYVEDNETNIEVMRGVLAQRPQIRLDVSLLGLDGMTAIRRTLPDLILLDMNLPDISGLELLRHLKRDELLAAIPVVVVSADATAANRKEALTSGAAHYVTKPLDMGRFLQLVDEILERADTRFG